MNFVRHKSLKGFLSSFFLRVISFQRALWTIRVRVNVHANPILAKLNSFFFFFFGRNVWKSNSFCRRLKSSGPLAGDDELSPKEFIDGGERTLREGKVQFFYLPVLFEGDVSWQRRRGLKINVAKGGSDSRAAGAVLLGGPIGLGCHFCYLILCM